MGWNLDIREYDSQLTKSQVEKEFDCDQATSAYDHGHSYSGQIGVMPNGIKWITRTFENAQEAYDYIEDNHNKWDQAFGVKIKDGVYLVGGWCSS